MNEHKSNFDIVLQIINYVYVRLFVLWMRFSLSTCTICGVLDFFSQSPSRSQYRFIHFLCIRIPCIWYVCVYVWLCVCCQQFSCYFVCRCDECVFCMCVNWLEWQIKIVWCYTTGVMCLFRPMPSMIIEYDNYSMNTFVFCTFSIYFAKPMQATEWNYIMRVCPLTDIIQNILLLVLSLSLSRPAIPLQYRY